MESTLNSFKEQQSKTLSLLARLETFLREGGDVGIDIDPALIDKVNQASKNLNDEKLKVALVGGFSEGKTSIAAAWMEKLDKSSMKISHQESSNEVKVYDVGEEFVLVDTPGLFGFKEQENSDTQQMEKYKDITKKHVSDAHLVLYVMNSTNPIKDSHKDDLHWLFQSLDILPRTVFVLSQFDEVADIEDEEDYQNNLHIKQENVTTRLQDLLSLTEAEASQLSIVAVAANPFDLGVEHWLQNSSEFKKLSHIELLQQATNDKIKSSGGYESLALEMQTSVVRDVLHKQLPEAIEADQTISEEVEKLQQLHSRLRDQLAHTNDEIEQTRINLREFISGYFSDLILQAQGCSLETVNEFVQRELGDEGIIVETNLRNEFSRQMGPINLQLEKMQSSFDNELSHFDKTLRSMGKSGINQAAKSNIINNKTILAARDGVVSVAKTLGVDIAKYLKFKPYGADKLAKGANGALALLGLAIEAYDSYDKYQREEKFNNSIKELVEGFEKQRRELLELINSDDFKEQFFGNYQALKVQIEELSIQLEKTREQQQQFRDWREEAESIASQLTTQNTNERLDA